MKERHFRYYKSYFIRTIDVAITYLSLHLLSLPLQDINLTGKDMKFSLFLKATFLCRFSILKQSEQSIEIRDKIFNKFKMSQMTPNNVM